MEVHLIFSLGHSFACSLESSWMPHSSLKTATLPSNLSAATTTSLSSASFPPQSAFDLARTERGLYPSPLPRPYHHDTPPAEADSN